jgi:hypothetical protein
MKSNTFIIIIVLCVLIVLPLIFSLPKKEAFETADHSCPSCDHSKNKNNHKDNKIAVFMYCTPDLLAKWGSYTFDINNHYARKNGYDFHFFGEPFDPSVTHAWQKIPAFIKMFEHINKYKYVMYIDTDAIFYDQSIKIEDIINKYDGDIIVCSDEANSDGKYKVNGGSLIVKNTPASIKLLNSWWDLRHEYKEFAFEQWALSDIVENKIEGIDGSIISVAPETEFNSVYNEVQTHANDTRRPAPNRYVLHYMAMDDKTREHVFSKFHEELVPENERKYLKLADK